MRLPPEQRLLLLSCGDDASRAEFERLAQMPLDWERLTSLAMQWRAVSALWRRLGQIPGEPSPRTATLKAQAAIHDFRILRARAILTRVVARLQSRGIDVMLLKGAAFLAEHDTRPIARSMADLDLLVVKGSAPDAWRLCREEGWRPGDPAWTEEMYDGHQHLPPLVDPDGIALGLELHRELMAADSPMLIDQTAVISRARRLRLGDTPVLVPSVEDMLLHACVHFAWSHAMEFGGWRTFVDAHALVGDHRFSWSRFLTSVEDTSASSCCYWTLRLARRGTGLSVPPEVLEALRPRVNARIADALDQHFLNQMVESVAAELPLRLRRRLWAMAIQPRRSGLGRARPWSVGVTHAPRGTDQSRASAGAGPGALARSVDAIAYVRDLFRKN